MLVNSGNFTMINNTISNLLNGKFGEVNLSLPHNLFFTSSVILLSEKLRMFSVIKYLDFRDATLKKSVIVL